MERSTFRAYPRRKKKSPLMVKKILLHIGKNLSKARRWQMSVAPSQNSCGVRVGLPGADPMFISNVYLHYVYLQCLPNYYLHLSLESVLQYFQYLTL